MSRHTHTHAHAHTHAHPRHSVMCSFISHLIIEHINCVNLLKKCLFPPPPPEACWQLQTMETEHMEAGEALVHHFHNRSDSSIYRLHSVWDSTVHRSRRCPSPVLGLGRHDNSPSIRFLPLFLSLQGHQTAIHIHICTFGVTSSRSVPRQFPSRNQEEAPSLINCLLGTT